MQEQEFIEARIQKGIALLDQKNPGWYKDIDLETLDIERCEGCVLGQIYGFITGSRILGIRGEERAEHGFDIEYTDSREKDVSRYIQLTEAWRPHIEDMQEGERLLV